MIMTTFPHILAQRPGGALLVALDARYGCVYMADARVVYPRLPLASLLAQPYWQPYHGHDHGHGQELRAWPGPPPTLHTPASPPEP